MINTVNVSMIVEAIESVKKLANQAMRDAKKAHLAGQTDNEQQALARFHGYMSDLMTLEHCLAGEVSKVLKSA